MPYGRNQGQDQGHSREVDRQSPTGLIFNSTFNSLLALMLEFVVLRAAVIALESLAVLPCFMYFIVVIIVLLWANK